MKIPTLSSGSSLQVQPSQAPVSTAPGGDEWALGFALNFISGRGLLTTRARRFGPLNLKALTLEIPNIAFPFDVSGGAERFKNQRCILRQLAFGLDPEGLQSLLAHANLAANGFTGVRVAIGEGHVELAGVFKAGDAQADFTMRASVMALAAHELHVVFYDTRIYGWLPLAAPLLPVYLRQALGFKMLDNSRAGAWRLRPAEQFVRQMLPRGGWKIPSLAQAHFVTAEICRNQISINVGPDDDPTPRQQAERALPPAAVRALEGITAFAPAEEALGRGAIRDAYQLLREALDDGRGGPWARERLLQIGAADPELFVETQNLAEETLAQKHDDIAALLALAAIAAHTSNFAIAAKAYADLAAGARQRKERLDILAAEMACGAAASRVDPQQALHAYERAAARAHDSELVQSRVFVLRRTTGDFAGAAEAGERWVALLHDPPRAAQGHWQLGQLYLSQLNDYRRARLHFERALRLNPEAIDALEGLAETYAARGEPARAATYLVRLAEAAEALRDSGRVIALNLRLGDIWLRWLNDPDSAATRYHRVLDIDPEHRPARLKLAQIAEKQGDATRARALYRDVLSLADDAGAEGMTPERRADMVTAYVHLAELIRNSQGPAAEVLELLQQAVGLDPDHLAARQELLALLRQHREWDRLLQVLAVAASRPGDVEGARSAHLEAARVELLERRDRRAARLHLETILDATPDDREALQLYLPMLEAQNEHVALARRLELAAFASPEAGVRADLLFRLAAVQQGLDQPAAARCQSLQTALDANPFHLAAARALVDLLRSAHDAPNLLDAYDRLIVAAPNATLRGETLLAKATLLGRDMGRSNEAIEAVRDAVQEPTVATDAWLLWAELLQDSGALPAARQVLEQALQQVDAKESFKIYSRLADMGRANHDSASEAKYLAAAVAAGQPDAATCQRLVTVLTDIGRASEAADWLERWAAANAPLDRSEAWLQAAQLRQNLGDLDAARALYLRVLENGGRAAPGAAQAFETLARQRADWRDVVRALQSQLASTPAPQQAAVLSRLIPALVQAGDTAAAEAAASRLLELEPQSVLAHQHLAQRFEAAGAWDRALDHWLYLALVCPRGELALPLRRDVFVRALAMAQEIRPAAVSSLQETMRGDFAPDVPAMPPPLGQQLRAQSAWESLLALRQLQLAHATLAQSIAYRREIAEILHHRLGRSVEAATYYQEVNASDPADLQVQAALVDIYTQLGRWLELARLEYALSQLSVDPERALGYAIESAHYYADVLDDMTAARQVMVSLLDRQDIAPDAPRLVDALRHLGMRNELAHALDTGLNNGPSADDGRFVELTNLLIDPLKDPARALEWCARMIKAFPDAAVPRRRQVDILQAYPELGDSRQVLQAWAAQVPAGPERATLLRELATAQRKAGDDDAAVATLGAAADADPTDLQVVDALIERNTARGDWPTVLTWLQRAADIETTPKARDERLRRIIEVADEFTASPQLAISALSRLQARTSAETAHYIELCQRTGDYAALAEVPDAMQQLSAAQRLEALRLLAKKPTPSLDVARGLAEPLLRDAGYLDAAWDILADLWRRAGKLRELTGWRLQALETTPAEHILALRLMAAAEQREMVGISDPKAQIMVEADLAAADLKQLTQAWAMFCAARAWDIKQPLQQAAKALESHLTEEDPRLVMVLRERAHTELDGGDANLAVAVARRLLALGDASGAQWLEDALGQAGRHGELLELLVQRAQRGGPDAPVVWTRIAGLMSERGSFREAAASLLRVDPAARTKRWGELQYNIGKQDHNAAMRAAGAQVCAQFSSDKLEQANWLRLAAQALWWDMDDTVGAHTLLQQAHALTPLQPSKVATQARAMLEAGDKVATAHCLDEALLVLSPAGTAALWLLLAQVQHTLGNASRLRQALDQVHALASDDSTALLEAARLAEAAELRDVQLVVRRALYALDKKLYGNAYFDILNAVGEWNELVDALDQSAQSVEPVAAAARLNRAADIVRGRFADPVRAAELQVRAALLSPSLDNTRPAFDSACEAGRSDLVAKIGGLLLKQLGPSDPTRQSVLRHYVTALDSQGRADLAHAVRHELLERGWASAADKISLAQGEMEPAVAAQLLTQAAQDCAPAERAATLLGATAAWQKAKDPVRAAEVLQQALALGTDDLPTHRLAVQLLQGQARLHSLSRIIDLRGDADLPDAERAKCAASWPKRRWPKGMSRALTGCCRPPGRWLRRCVGRAPPKQHSRVCRTTRRWQIFG